MTRITLAFLVLSCLAAADKFNPKNLPALVWWTDLLYPHPGGWAEISCPGGGRCASTRRRRKWRRERTAFLFYGTDFQGEDLPLPRRSGHVWSLLHEESPMNNFLLCHPQGIGLFKLSATFSRHSHFPLPTQHLPSLRYLTRRAPVDTPTKNQLRAQGLAPVLYLQSHCGVASDRDRYVSRLMDFLPVDSYGRCLHNRDLPPHLHSTDTHNAPELMDFIARYKFHLAFENALCEDYITEKLWRALHVGAVPVYRGSPSARDWAPSNQSLILADDFPGPRELAHFIMELDANDEFYEAYLSYKVDGISNEFLKKALQDRTWSVDDPMEPWNGNNAAQTDFIRGFECYVCDQLCGVSAPPSPPDQRHMNCPPPLPSLKPEEQRGQEETSDSCSLNDPQSSCRVAKRPTDEEE